MALSPQNRESILTPVAREEAPGKRFEYKTVKLPGRGDADKWGKLLSEEGSQGWRLVDHWIAASFLGAEEIGLLERELPPGKG
jgi:hypothetical protein